MQDVFEAIRDRRSIRKFSGKPVEQDKIEELINLALTSHSARNIQPRHFTVVTKTDILNELDKDTRAVMQEQGTPLPAGQHVFYCAPSAIVVSIDKNHPWAEVDCGIAVATICLAAEGLGLGSCVIGMAQRAFKADDAKYRNLLQLPEGYTPAICVALGYADEQPAATERERKVNIV